MHEIELLIDVCIRALLNTLVNAGLYGALLIASVESLRDGGDGGGSSIRCNAVAAIAPRSRGYGNFMFVVLTAVVIDCHLIFIVAVLNRSVYLYWHLVPRIPRISARDTSIFLEESIRRFKNIFSIISIVLTSITNMK